MIRPRVLRRRLNDGQHRLPLVGFGCWRINHDRVWSLGSWLFNDDNRAARVIYEAIKLGYRYIDGAYFYNIEKAIGYALRRAFADGLVKREQMFITTKVWNNFHSRDRVIENLKISLRELGLSYVDMALIHWPTGFSNGDNVFPMYCNLSNIPRDWEPNSYLETWAGMEDALQLGLTKTIGVANFNIKQLQTLLQNSNIKPVVNQVECNPYYNQIKMLEFCKNNSILMTAYSPLRQGYDLLEEQQLREIAGNHNKTVAQVALRWNIQRGVAVIPKTVNPIHMRQNIYIFDFNLTDQEMQIIDGLKQRPKLLTLGTARSHPDYPFTDGV
ncbi:1,5-anhydro-D-fructose reductase-like [Oppia nitens]|uniref:1,5-anhydro-D-fructose reductase-like n=1 Tax=Oppia nitens TaxID=1686743 RepID=UPI0023DC7715|nr:1,5-anhydro-D-fructose reductase-like [Oppia nitens]